MASSLQAAQALFFVLLLSLSYSFLVSVGEGLFPAVLKLKSAFPERMEIDALRANDGARHRRLFQSSTVVEGIVDFPAAGSSNPFTVGLYYTRVKLGTPPKEFYVQIDTGSDILWVACDPCSGCPKSSGLNIQLHYFNPARSSTASLVTCLDDRCTYGLQTLEATCSSSSSMSSVCDYSFQYGDGSGTSGFYISDLLYFDTILRDLEKANSSSTVVFGCSNSQLGDLTKPDRAVDGILGLGQHKLSVVSQLSSHGVVPKVFSHCLRGADNGGGILVLGEIVEPGIVYSPLVQSQRHYNLNLQSIAVNGQNLPIDSLMFLTSRNQGTIVDSGTTLAYLAQDAYDVLINSINASVAQSMQSFISKGNLCFITSSSISEVFPSISLNFDGEATMIMKPQDYLLQQNDATTWCMGLQRGQGITILGDLVLKDKIFVYDLAGQRLGWKAYDCSLPVKAVMPISNTEFMESGQLTATASSPAVGKLQCLSILLIIIYVLIL